MKFGERLKNIRADRDLSQDMLAEILGTSKQVISRYETGQRTPKITVVSEYAEKLGVPLDYLLGDDDNIPVAKNIIPLPKMRMVPLVGTIACGTPILAAENIMANVPMPENVRADFALRCQGDSMTGARVYDGDIVYIRTQPDVENGEIAAVLLGEEATLKRVYKAGQNLILQPENTQYQPIVIAGGDLDGCRIIGKAVAFTSVMR